MDTLLRSEKTGKSTQLNSDGKRHDAQIFAPNCNSHHKILMVFQRNKQLWFLSIFLSFIPIAVQTYT